MILPICVEFSLGFQLDRQKKFAISERLSFQISPFETVNDPLISTNTMTAHIDIALFEHPIGGKWNGFLVLRRVRLESRLATLASKRILERNELISKVVGKRSSQRAQIKEVSSFNVEWP